MKRIVEQNNGNILLAEVRQRDERIPFLLVGRLFRWYLLCSRLVHDSIPSIRSPLREDGPERPAHTLRGDASVPDDGAERLGKKEYDDSEGERREDGQKPEYRAP